MNNEIAEQTQYSPIEIEEAARELVDESRFTYTIDPHAFSTIQVKQETVQEFIRILDNVKQSDKFTGIILYGNSTEKLAFAQKAAAYLGCAYYDLVTDKEEEYDQDDVDQASAIAFSHRFTQLLAEDIQKQKRAIVCWIDRFDDIAKRKNSWEEELENQFEQTVLQLKNVIAIQILESPAILAPVYFHLIDAQWKIKIDDEL